MQSLSGHLHHQSSSFLHRTTARLREVARTAMRRSGGGGGGGEGGETRPSTLSRSIDHAHPSHGVQILAPPMSRPVSPAAPPQVHRTIYTAKYAAPPGSSSRFGQGTAPRATGVDEA